MVTILGRPRGRPPFDGAHGRLRHLVAITSLGHPGGRPPSDHCHAAVLLGLALRSSAALEGDRQGMKARPARSTGMLRSSVAPEDDRQVYEALGDQVRRLVAILGRPRGQPPAGWLQGSRLCFRVAILGRPERRPPGCTNRARAPSVRVLRSSFAPEGDCHDALSQNTVSIGGSSTAANFTRGRVRFLVVDGRGLSIHIGHRQFRRRLRC